MKKILFIHQSAELYGSDKTLLIFLKNIDREKFFPVVVLPGDGPLKEALELLKIKIVIAPVLKLYRDIFRFKNGFQFIKEIFIGLKIISKLHKEHHFDIVYSNTLAVLLGAFFSKLKKIKHIWHVHEIIEKPKSIAWLFPKMLYFFSDLIICNSHATKENIIQKESRNIRKTIVIHNGLEQIETISFAQKSDFGFNNNDIIITLVGRISRLKGHQWLLETFNTFFKNNKNLKLFFVGSPVPNQEYYLHDIEKYILENNLSDNVTIIPFTKNLMDIWKITDIAVMPSTEKESFGLVAAEAMMAKKPVIAANHGGLTEIVINNETGFLVEPNNINDLKTALETLIENPDLRKFFGENGYRRVMTIFNIKNYVLKLETVLIDL